MKIPLPLSIFFSALSSSLNCPAPVDFDIKPGVACEHHPSPALQQWRGVAEGSDLIYVFVPPACLFRQRR